MSRATLDPWGRVRHGRVTLACVALAVGGCQAGPCRRRQPSADETEATSGSGRAFQEVDGGGAGGQTLP